MLDLQLGNVFRVFNHSKTPYLDPQNPKTLEDATAEVSIAEGEAFILHPGEFVLAITKEYVEIPDDLPMRPFESAPHIWPFSKYKQVFHGDVMPPLSEEERILANKNMPPKKVLTKKVVVKRAGFDGEDEGLILMTGFSLLVIILLLAYMYSNGRI
jgi:hypothetical protein